MYRGTTPTLIFKINNEEIDFESLKQVWITICSPTYSITKEIDDVVIDSEKKTIKVELTQEETLGFHHAKIAVQIRFLTNTDVAFASPVKEIFVEKILKEGVIE